jgi:hypothetical protein
MEQQFQLKYYGDLSIFEQNNMTSEDRSWWAKRLEKEIKESSDRERKQFSSLRSGRSPRK